MNYLASHLPKGEKIYAKTHKSAFIFMRDVLIAVLLFGIAVGVQLGFKVDTKIMIWVYIVCAVVVVFCLCDSAVRYASTLLVVTTHKFMYKEDIITIKVFDTQLQNIDSVEVSASPCVEYRRSHVAYKKLRPRVQKPVPSRPFQRSTQQTRVGRAGRQDRKDLHLVCNRQIARPLR